jgi:hypothetical protein
MQGGCKTTFARDVKESEQNVVALRHVDGEGQLDFLVKFGRLVVVRHGRRRVCAQMLVAHTLVEDDRQRVSLRLKRR